MLSLSILKLLYYINVTYFKLLNNQPSIREIPFVKTDDLFHIKAIALGLCNGLAIKRNPMLMHKIWLLVD